MVHRFVYELDLMRAMDSTGDQLLVPDHSLMASNNNGTESKSYGD